MLAALCQSPACELVTLYLKRPRRLATAAATQKGCTRCRGAVHVFAGETSGAICDEILEGMRTSGYPESVIGRFRRRFERARTRLEHRTAVRDAVQAACEGQPWYVMIEAQIQALARFHRAQQRKSAAFKKWEQQAVAAARELHRARRRIEEVAHDPDIAPDRATKVQRALEAAALARKAPHKPFRRHA